MKKKNLSNNKWFTESKSHFQVQEDGALKIACGNEAFNLQLR